MLQLTNEQVEAIQEALGVAYSAINDFEEGCTDDGLLQQAEDARLAIAAAEDILDPEPLDAQGV